MVFEQVFDRKIKIKHTCSCRVLKCIIFIESPSKCKYLHIQTMKIEHIFLKLFALALTEFVFINKISHF